MRFYANWLKAYVRHTRYTESPDSFHFWTGVSTIAGALRRRVWIDQRIFQWTPNFYIILVGPPGIAAKSTSVRSGLNLLERTNCGIHFGPQSVTWQALMEALQNAHEVVEYEDSNQAMSCLTIGVSELGTFFRPDNKEMVDFLVAMWDGQKEIMRRQTKTQGAMVIHNPWLNVIGCTTPSWLKENFPDALVGGGLTSRMVFVFADKKRQLIPYPADLITAEDYGDEEDKLINDLQEIAAIKGEYQLSPAAKVWGSSWYGELWTGQRPEHLAGDKFAGYLARKQTMLHKLAIVIAAAQRNDLIINEDDLKEANDILLLTEIDLRKVFQSIGVSPIAKVNSDVLSIVRTQRRILSDDLYRTCYLTMGQREYTEAIKAAVQAKYIKVDRIDGKEYITYTGPLL